MFESKPRQMKRLSTGNNIINSDKLRRINLKKINTLEAQ